MKNSNFEDMGISEYLIKYQQNSKFEGFGDSGYLDTTSRIQFLKVWGSLVVYEYDECFPGISDQNL